MQTHETTLFVTFGRILLALYFLLPGFAKLAAPDVQLELMQHHGIAYAAILLPIAGLAQMLGAFALLSNRHVRLTCLGFVLYILIINYTLHDFWHFTGPEAAHELQNFIKNLGILAGLLVLAGISPVRRIKISELLRSDRAK
ncbi:MAG: hypothetical protein COA47_08120 [Robiginitomaculum sp.]|nr:MAG: hypothetical protein COA47_08120 [Robiginitomaculum sp.]